MSNVYKCFLLVVVVVIVLALDTVVVGRVLHRRLRRSHGVDTHSPPTTALYFMVRRAVAPAPCRQAVLVDSLVCPAAETPEREHVLFVGGRGVTLTVWLGVIGWKMSAGT